MLLLVLVPLRVLGVGVGVRLVPRVPLLLVPRVPLLLVLLVLLLLLVGRGVLQCGGGGMDWRTEAEFMGCQDTTGITAWAQ